MSPAETVRTQPVWPFFCLGAFAIAVLLTMSPVPFNGTPFGNDDMMRMQQIRDLIAGQAWYDVSQNRLLTPEGGAMHWSRLPDLIPAGIVWLLQPLAGRETAEGIAVTAWPTIQLAWVIAAVVACLRRLGASMPAQLLGLVFFCASFALAAYLPGRIDHHGLGVALALTAFACLLSPQRTPRSAALAATCTAAMITVAIENLPAAGLVITGFGLAWIVRGDEEIGRLRVFGGTLIITCLFAYVFDAPGAGGYRAVCDAYGQAHFIALLVAGTGLFAIATFFPDTQDWRIRTGAMLTAGLVTLVSFAMMSPPGSDGIIAGCLGDPYARLPENVRAGWLETVSEARPLPLLFATDLSVAVYVYGFAFAGVISALTLLMTGSRERLLDHGLLVLFCVAGTLLACWQVRAAPLAHSMATVSAAALTGSLLQSWRQTRTQPAALMLLIAILFATPLSWKLPVMSGRMQPAQSRADCHSAEAFQPIEAVPRMIAFTPINLGAPLIYHTRHYATAAPYHRNPSAIGMTVDVFTGSPEAARRKIEMTGATHLLHCPGQSELKHYARMAPDGLAAVLEAGNPPRWLVRAAGTDEGTGPVLYSINYERN